MKNLLTIAGSDSSGGAGIQADLKTFAAHGCYGMSVITAVTAQNTQGVFRVQDIEPEVITAQIDAVFSDIRVDAVKLGMLSQPAAIHAVAAGLRKYQPQVIVLDPVMVSKSGYNLLAEQACQDLINELLPLATLITPNITEAEKLLGRSIATKEDMMQAAQELVHRQEVQNVLLKGGHLAGEADDYLYLGEGTGRWYESARIATKNTHGTGCTLSSALAANLAQGLTLPQAVEASKAYVTLAIEHSLSIGSGCGPTHHFVTMYKKAGIE